MVMLESHNDPRCDRARAIGGICCALLLAVVVLAGHGGALWDGVRHDDHLHRYNLRHMGWSWHDLIESTTFDFPGRQLHFWWQDEPVQWRYPRPVTMLILKTEFTLAGGNAMGMHAFSLLWHWLCALLVFRLARWALASTGWGLLAAVFFVLGANATLTASWTAAHNTLISTFLLLSAVWAYRVASLDARREPASLRWGWLVLCVVFWLFGLFSREAVIVLPGLTAGLDLCFGGWRHLRRRWWWHALLLVIGLGFVFWRLKIFPTGPFPGGYFLGGTGWGYALWAVAKLLQTLGLATLNFPLFAPLDYLEGWSRLALIIQAVLSVVTLLGLLVYARLSGGVRGRWFWLIWLVATFLPVIPIASMPHFAYLPAVGWAVGLTVVLARLRRPWLTVAALAWTVVFVQGQRVMVRSMFRAEQLAYRDILDSTPPPPPGSTLYFVNMPLTTSFAAYALREAWDMDEIEAYALTLAPEGQRVTRRTDIEPHGNRELVISTEEPGFFSSHLERWFLRLTGTVAPLKAGQVVPGGQFDTTILDATDAGVTKLKFTFHEPLDRAGCYVYVTTTDRPAYRLRFDADFGEVELTEETARFRAANAEWLAERDRPFRLRDWFEQRFRGDEPR
jgi:hypothetical protein